MKTCKIQLKDVIYNAAEQCFEAIVTVHDTGRSFKYACAINAPISTSFSDAALGLAKQANRRHLETFTRYLVEEGFLPGAPALDDLFVSVE